MCLAYSPSGKVLGVICQDDDHNMAAYNTETGQLIASSKGDRGNIIEMSFQDDNTFATAGSKHFKLWTISGGTIKGKAGTFGTNDQRIGSCVFNGKTALTGCITGAVYQWNGGSLAKTFKNHTKLVDAITVDQNSLFTGGRDSLVVKMDRTSYAVQQKWDFSVPNLLFSLKEKYPVSAQIRAIT
jgi:hypothetical protein